MLILITSFPKSGSTFLYRVLSCLPGYRPVVLIPGYDRREQEICRSLIAAAQGQNGVARHHVRASEPTLQLIAEFQIKPVVLVRNLYDSLLSLAEHIASTTPVVPMAYFDQSFAEKPLSFRLDAVVDLAAAWYVNFYVSWQRNRPQDIVRYEDVVIGGAKGILRLLESLQVPVTLAEIEAAIDEVRRHHKTRFRVGKVGRGEPQMTAANRERIARLTSFYPDVDFRPIGLEGSTYIASS